MISKVRGKTPGRNPHRSGHWGAGSRGWDRVFGGRRPRDHRGISRVIGPGSVVLFLDPSEGYIRGQVIDDSTLRVLKSNLVSPGRILLKNPFMSWRTAVRHMRNGCTRLRPRDLLGMTLFFGADWAQPGPASA